MRSPPVTPVWIQHITFYFKLIYNSRKELTEKKLKITYSQKIPKFKKLKPSSFYFNVKRSTIEKRQDTR